MPYPNKLTMSAITSHLCRLLATGGWDWCMQVDGSCSGPSGLRNPWCKGRSGDYNSGLRRWRKSCCFSTWGVGCERAWLMSVVSDWGCGGYCGSLLGDLMHNGLHKLWWQARDVHGWGGAFGRRWSVKNKPTDTRERALHGICSILTPESA